MYNFLLRYLPPWLAEVLLVLWYAVLIVLVLLLASQDPGDFRYGRM